MKDYIEERAVEIAYYIIENKATVRQTAVAFGVKKIVFCPFTYAIWRNRINCRKIT